MDIRITPEGKVPFFFGRTLYDPHYEAMFCNWTASGFALAFTGGRVEMEATAIGDGFPGEVDNLPRIAVFTDGNDEPRVIRLEAGRHTYSLFEGGAPGEHVLRVVKRTENSKGRMGIHRLTLAGEARPYTPPAPRRRLEFVGDSITCGFGNDMRPDETAFSPEKEDGLTAYPAVAAKLLDAEYQSLCISGIPLCWASDPDYRIRLPEFPDFTPPPRSMEKLYPYADRDHQTAEGMSEGFTPWDFGRFRPDAIVINLGTNDAFRISVTGNDPAEAAHFRKRYTAFLQTVRSLNGPGPVIACTIGPMNYFLYDVIEKAADDYRLATGDQRLFCLKFGAIDPWGEGYGGLMHPNGKTHARMGRELAAALAPWLSE